MPNCEDKCVPCNLPIVSCSKLLETNFQIRLDSVEDLLN